MSREIDLSNAEFREYLLNQPDKLTEKIGDWGITLDENEIIRTICPQCKK